MCQKARGMVNAALGLVQTVAASFFLLFSGCSYTLPPEVVVHNTIEPSDVDSGSTVHWKVDVENSGEDVAIERCVVSESATEGWAVGIYDFQEELAITNTSITAGASETIYEKTRPVFNSGPNEIQITNTVTVYTDQGKSYVCACVYQILPR
jgi:hypothetical protein